MKEWMRKQINKNSSQFQEWLQKHPLLRKRAFFISLFFHGLCLKEDGCIFDAILQVRKGNVGHTPLGLAAIKSFQLSASDS